MRQERKVMSTLTFLAMKSLASGYEGGARANFPNALALRNAHTLFNAYRNRAGVKTKKWFCSGINTTAWRIYIKLVAVMSTPP
jgi:hypothetical protein